MPEQDIHFDLADGVLRITLDRPDAGNSLTHDQREAILDWLARANDDIAIRCVVIGATGRFFCTGADLRQSGSAPEERRVGDLRRTMKGGAIRLVNAILDCERPVIAAVQGTAAGIGPVEGDPQDPVGQVEVDVLLGHGPQDGTVSPCQRTSPPSPRPVAPRS